MNTSAIANVATTQRCKRCTFDSPGLASEDEGYPGLFAVSGNNAVGVVPFILRHFIAASHAEKTQHLRRDLLTTYITQGRLVPTLGYQRYNAFSVELKWYYNPRHFTR